MNLKIVKFGHTQDHLEQLVRVNLEALSKMQSNILWKYEMPAKVSIANCKPKGFIERLDHYILHAIEEIVEARIENRPLLKSTVSNYLFKKDFLVEEMLDIVLYLGTIRALLEFNLYVEPDTGGPAPEAKRETVEPTYPKEKRAIIKPLHASKYDPESFDTMMSEVVERLIYLRMLFPERKWHKPYEDATPVEIRDRLISGIEHIDYAILGVFSELFHISSETEINEILEKKHRFVMGLQKVEGGETV